MSPLTNITPFTYRDGTTYMEILEKFRVYVNETMRPEFVTEMDRIIDDFQAGIANVEARVVESETEYDALIADAKAYVDASVQFINNKTGQAQIQRVTLTGPYTVEIDPVWPNNHPIHVVLTQDATGGRVVTWSEDIVGTVAVDPAPGAETEFTLVPEGDGSWVPVQYLTAGELDAEVETINTALGTKANASAVTASLALKADTTALTAETTARTAALALKADATTVAAKQDKSTAVTAAHALKTIAGAIRNSGAGWTVIDDAGHTPVGIDSVTADATGITVHYAGLNVTEVGTFTVTPDETLANAGFFCGASVGLDSAIITLNQSARTYSDYVYYDGTTWQQNGSTFGSISFNPANGILTVTHPDLVDGGFFNVALTGRGSTVNYTPIVAGETGGVGGVGTGEVHIKFLDFNGAVVTAANTNMKVFINHGGGTRTVSPLTVSTTSYPNSNLWLHGLMKVA